MLFHTRGDLNVCDIVVANGSYNNAIYALTTIVYICPDSSASKLAGLQFHSQANRMQSLWVCTWQRQLVNSIISMEFKD